ncbi:MAG: hypothetical protein ACI9BK_001927 [Acidimicrobiales bacterium]
MHRSLARRSAPLGLRFRAFRSDRHPDQMAGIDDGLDERADSSLTNERSIFTLAEHMADRSMVDLADWTGPFSIGDEDIRRCRTKAGPSHLCPHPPRS